MDPSERLAAWVASELEGKACLDSELATRIATRVVPRPTLDATATRDGQEDVKVHNWYVSQAASTVTCARATARCPGQGKWWHGAGAEVLALLLDGRVALAEVRQAEMLAGHYDFDFDPNWPEYKRFRVLEAPEHLPIGSRLIGSDEQGMRAEFEIVEREGVRGLQRTNTPVSHATGDIWKKAHQEATMLAACPQRPADASARLQ